MSRIFLEITTFVVDIKFNIVNHKHYTQRYSKEKRQPCVKYKNINLAPAG